MDRKRIVSSNVASIGYDAASQTLEVEFLNGSVYQYYNVPAGVFEQFEHAPSKGAFLNEQIRNLYPFSRVG
jgi:hypothetical protein